MPDLKVDVYTRAVIVVRVNTHLMSLLDGDDSLQLELSKDQVSTISSCGAAMIKVVSQ